MDHNDTDLAHDDARAGATPDGPGMLVLANPSATDAFGYPHWWSATRVVRLPRGTSMTSHEGSDRIDVEVVYDVDPVESGLDEYRWRPTPEPVQVAYTDLLRPVNPDHHAEFTAQRARHRTQNGLPRCVVRSDLYDKATKTRAPLYALRHPWPPGTFVQGGRHSKLRAATPAEVADPDVHTTDDGQTLGDVGVFLEAFPPATAGNTSGGFMRTTAATFADAEDKLWDQWQRQTGCPALAATGAHRWEPRGYHNGAGFCADCNVFGSQVFDVAEVGVPCVVCGTRTWWDHVGEVGGTVDGTGKLNRYVQERVVCPEHTPPHVHDVTERVHRAARDRLPGGLPDCSWFTRFLPAGAEVTGVAYADLADAVYDGRAALVDDVIAGDRDPGELAELTRSWGT